MLQDFVFVALTFLLALTGYYRWRKPSLPFPPGPKGYPIIGNLLDVPSEQRWVKFLEWSKEYST